MFPEYQINIRMIFEWSCDTEDISNLHFVLKCNTISQYCCFRKCFRNLAKYTFVYISIHSLLAEAIYTNSAHQHVIGLVKITKYDWQLSALVLQMVKCVWCSFWCDRPGFETTFRLTFSLPFQISNRIRKVFIFKKNDGNNHKVENKSMG